MPWVESQFKKKNNFALSDVEDNTSALLNRGGYSRFIFVENIIGSWPKVLTARFLGSDELLFYYHMQIWQLQESFCNDYWSV